MLKAVHEILDIKSQPSYFDVVSVNLPSNLRLLVLQEDLLTSKERVDYVFEIFNVRLTDRNEGSEKLRKNSAVASKLRQRGNEFYKNGDLIKALEWYSVAVMFAPGGDQELGLAFANRSAVLAELRHPEEALKDIELALLNNYPKPSVLENREKRCKEMIEQRNKIRDDEEQEFRRKMEEEIRERQKMREEMLRIKNSNPRIPEAANFVTIQYDEVMGRKLVVTQDVPAGTVLMVSEPYVTALNYNEGWNSEHCHHCLRRIRRGIPCEKCVFAIYCNEACRQEAYKEYHKFECPCMDYLSFCRGDQPLLLAFKIVCKAGPKKLYQLYRSEDPSYFKREEPYGVEEGCTFKDDPYLAVYHMATHTEKLNEADVVNARKTYNAVVLALILQKRSAFFREIPKQQQTDFGKFVATLIRHHIDAMNVNPTPVIEWGELEGMSLADFFTDELNLESSSRKIQSSWSVPYAMGVYPLGSLINHSCDPNVYYLNEGSKGRTVTIASRHLMAGDVIYGAYGVLFTRHPLDYRQQTLKTAFFFTCQCIACVNDWPTLQEALLRVYHFCCPTCSVKYSAMEKASPDFKKKCGLNEAGSWKCGSCQKQYSEDTLKLLLATKLEALARAKKLVESNRPREVIPVLLDIIDFVQTYLCPPWYYLGLAVDELCRASALLFHSFPLRQ